MPIYELVLAAFLLVLAGGIAGFSRLRRGKASQNEREEESLHDLVWRASEGEERYRALVAATTDLVVQRDVNGRITYADEGYARLLGRAPAELIGEAIEPDSLDGDTVSVRHDGLRRIETRIQDADGRDRWFDVVEVPVGGEGPRCGPGPCRERERGEVPLPRHGQPRDAHASERHHRHDRSADRHGPRP